MTTRHLILLLTMGVAFLNWGCVPNVARLNARVEDGSNIALLGGTNWEKKGESTSQANSKWMPALELQYEEGFKRESGWAFAGGVKIPAQFYFSSLDLYSQFPSSGSHYFGIGVEAGLLSALYTSYSLYMGESAYVTLTTRGLVNLGTVNGRQKHNGGQRPDSKSRFWLNPQLAFGFLGEGGSDISLFAGYTYILGRGYDVEQCWVSFSSYGDCPGENGEDLRKHFITMGISLRI